MHKRLLLIGLGLVLLPLVTTAARPTTITAATAPVWFYDGDGDGLGDPFIKKISLLWPGEPWVRNDDDCNDITTLPCPPL